MPRGWLIRLYFQACTCVRMAGWVPAGIPWGCARESPALKVRAGSAVEVRDQVLSHACVCCKTAVVERERDRR